MSAAITLQEISAKLDYGLIGDGALKVSAFKFAAEADENSLAVVLSDKEAIDTAARAVLTTPRILPIDKTFLYCNFKKMSAAIVDVARLMIDAGIYPDYEKNFEQVEKHCAMFGKNFEIGEGSYVGAFANIGENVKIGRNCKIGAGVYIGSDVEIGDGVKIHSGARIGANCHYHFTQHHKQKSFCGIGRALIEDGVEIGYNTVIQRGSLSDTVIGAGTIIGNLVEIGHDVKIGKDCLIVSQAGICGGVEIGERVQIYGQVGIADRVKIGSDATIMAKSGVTKDIRAGQVVSGMFSRSHLDELKRQAKFRKLTKGE